MKENLLDIRNNDIGKMELVQKKIVDNSSNDQQNRGKKKSENQKRQRM